MIRVVAPNRLHFGLFRVPLAGFGAAVKPGSAGDRPRDPAAGEARAFGGVGLMIERPGVVVVARPADAWQFEGALAGRAQVFAARFMASLPEDRRRPFQMLVERCPSEHAGLGVGTQLGLAVAKALAVGCGEPELTAADLARRVGRGERSAIGVHGFDRGGLLADAGKREGEAVSPLLAQVTLPERWRVVLFAPRADRWHGDRERAAFATARPGEPDALRRLAEEELLPAAARGDLDAFGAALHEFNRRAGEPFAAAQGGAYASGEVAELIADVRAAGVSGVGQSSWGPTVFAVVGDGDAALSLVERFGGRAPAFVSRISAGGHAVQGDGPPAG